MKIVELYVSLPYELKKIVLDYAPIEILISKNMIYIPNIIDEYIREYINKKLLYNISKSSYLHNTILYKHLIREKVNILSLYYAQKFMYYCNLYGGVVKYSEYMTKPFNKISFIILFKYAKKGPYYNSLEEPIFIISNDALNDENKCKKDYYNTIMFIDYNEDTITSYIYNALIREMHYCDTTKEIESMKIMKTSYTEGIKNNKIFTEEVLYNII